MSNFMACRKLPMIDKPFNLVLTQHVKRQLAWQEHVKHCIKATLRSWEKGLRPLMGRSLLSSFCIGKQPQKRSPWIAGRKSLSFLPGDVGDLLEAMKEVEAFNASKETMRTMGRR
ncbi:hypothetical protein Tco_0911032 [Tanacetum coccineum]|uniref:Uncharacterized protein n=1 Tax=Tanacetum coccineum TaxID=301880 RepID=A0ABQ5CWA2_9ASTR